MSEEETETGITAETDTGFGVTSPREETAGVTPWAKSPVAEPLTWASTGSEGHPGPKSSSTA